MDMETVRAVALRDLPARAEQWMYMATRQVGLIDASQALHARYLSEGGIESIQYEASGQYSERNDGSLYHRLMAIYQPTTIEEATPMLRELSFPGHAAELAARAFVYELAVLRNVLNRIVPLTPKPDTAQALVDAFMTRNPDIVGVRDTLAHLDERYVSEARGRTFTAQPGSIGRDTLNHGLAILPDRISTHMADGRFGEVWINENVVQQARQVVVDIAELFPMVPGLTLDELG